MKVNTSRLRENIETNAELGEVQTPEGRGRTTLTGTDVDKDVRDYFIRQLEEAGLSIRIDPLGNIAGRWTPDTADPTADAVVAGSHLDSVPEGGMFDGPLGVYGALEAIRVLKESESDLSRPVEVVSFTEEEGVRFKNGLLGSSVVADLRDIESARQLTDESGHSLGDELERIGYAGTDTIDANEWHAWVEVHIEQSTRLEDSPADIGVVDAIAGLTNCRVEFVGESNHAGATPMGNRRDALAAASEYILALEEITSTVVQERGEPAVGTVGEIHVTPNAKNVIAGSTELIVDVRSVAADAIEDVLDPLQESQAAIEAKRNVRASFDQYRYTPPQQMAERCIQTAISAAEAEDVAYTRMHSPALHDTANVATTTETVMLFAPSEDGISHNPREWTEWEDCYDVTRVLAETMRRLAT
ncbi:MULTISPECIES: Zn-dependent hydrolase [Salinibaculum]|uniref:Zn-dependent hydrolase n=1 Tax=Salinibaculum TaxID=2732368 RepID=UPI0030CC230C